MKTAIAMSGGVDSTACAVRLLKEGHSCKGFLMKLLSGDKAYEKKFGENIDILSKICKKFGMEYEVVDFSDEFEKSVISHFVDVYKKAMTPNPCIFCNPVIKFGLLLDYIKSLGFEHLATGHYARIVTDEGITYLEKGADLTKDQSYFLSRIPRERFKDVLFPLGETTKEDNIALVKDEGLYFMKGESQEICFIPDDDYTLFLKDRLACDTSGSFIDETGKTVGKHKGIEFYTIGQRRGLGVAMGFPAYVRKINKDDNTIEVGDKLSIKEFFINDVNILAPEFLNEKLCVKIRYRHRGCAVASVLNAGDKRFKLTLSDFEESLTPGQSAVLYSGNRVVASGYIERY